MKSSFELAVALVLAVASSGAGASLAQSTERVNIDSSGAQANGLSYKPSISADARFIAFESTSTNLVAGDANSFSDIFVHDRSSGTTELVSVATSGAQGNGSSSWPLISADGRFVAFDSGASNLVTGDTNGWSEVFVRDRANGTTVRASVATGGTQADAGTAVYDISADGRFVLFIGSATNLVAGDTNGTSDVFVRDLASGTTERVSVASGGAQANGFSHAASISADGNVVAFQSSATNLVPFDSNAAWDVFVHDRISGTTERVSIAPNGAQGNSHSEEPSLSDDGRFVAFRSQASNLVAGDTNGATDVFTRDRQTGITERSSVDSSGAEANSHSVDSTLSADGRCVVFYSLASNLIAVDGNDNLDVFVHDRASGTTERASVDMSGWEANSDSLWPAVSSDGRFVAFESLATNLVGGDTNGLRDIFVRDIFVRDRGAPPPVAYCTAGTTSSGCIAVMSSTGTPSVTATSGFTLSAGGVEGQKSGLIFYGISGRLAAPWGSGSSSFLCVKSPTQRMATQNTGGTDGACDGTLSEDWLAFVAAHPGALGAPFAAGQTVNAQGWFRDPPAAKTTSLSNGLEFTVGP